MKIKFGANNIYIGALDGMGKAFLFLNAILVISLFTAGFNVLANFALGIIHNWESAVTFLGLSVFSALGFLEKNKHAQVTKEDHKENIPFGMQL